MIRHAAMSATATEHQAFALGEREREREGERCGSVFGWAPDVLQDGARGHLELLPPGRRAGATGAPRRGGYDNVISYNKNTQIDIYIYIYVYAYVYTHIIQTHLYNYNHIRAEPGARSRAPQGGARARSAETELRQPTPSRRAIRRAL